jgi:copper homeostasis protein (lipoprotein)
MRSIPIIAFILVLMIAFTACNRQAPEEKDKNTVVIKGLYSYGPEMKSFADCEEGREYWVADSAKTLYASLH